MSVEDFAALLDRDALPDRLELVQTSTSWTEDQAWMTVRDAIDALIFSQFLADRPLKVRRIVFLEPPEDAGMRGAEEHRRWVSGLVRDLYYLGMPMQGSEAPYQIRQLVRDPRAADLQTLVSDGWNVADTSWRKEFETTWTAPRCIESNLIPPDYPVGPIGDQDPRWYLWH